MLLTIQYTIHFPNMYVRMDIPIVKRAPTITDILILLRTNSRLPTFNSILNSGVASDMLLCSLIGVSKESFESSFSFMSKMQI